MLFSNTILCNISIFCTTVCIITYTYIKWKYGYWKRKGVVQLQPVFPFGNYFKALPRGVGLGYVTKTFYDQFKKMGVKFGGVYIGLDPYLLIMDPAHAKNIFTKDFQYFTDRGQFYSERDYMAKNLFTEEGTEWKSIRSKFTHMFTAAKLKNFFGTMKHCTLDLKKRLDESFAKDADVKIMETLGCYFTDVVGSAVYGIEAHSFKRPDAVFRQMGRDGFYKFSLSDRIMLFLSVCYPKLLKKLPLRSIFQHQISEFFEDFVALAVDHREKNNIHRDDFLQILMGLQNTDLKITLKEITAQSSLFFFAGFQSSTFTSSLTIFELALHQDFQDRVREEIRSVLEKYNGEVVYEAIGEMNLLSQAWHETTRKYPPLPTLNRVCVKETYTFENSDLTIEKGTPVIIPVLGFQRDENIYPDPLRWDPDRFADKDVKYEAYYPFGDGPRNCIGLRFGLLQVKLGLATVLRDYKVTISPKTKLPLKFDPLSFLTSPDVIYVNLTKVD